MDRTEFNTGAIGRLSSKRLSLAIGFIRAKLGEDICLEDIARAAGLSVFHFSRAFRNTTGVAPYGYLRQARVERVRELLVASEKTLSQIALEAGFSDQSHMSKVFKRFTGVAPRAFRHTYGTQLELMLGGPIAATLLSFAEPTLAGVAPVTARNSASCIADTVCQPILRTARWAT